jgi:molybdopterin-dependent oxidoreductase alpha subunit
MKMRARIGTYDRPAGGWGSAKSVAHILRQEGVPGSGALLLWRQNKPDGYMCVSCSWAKPAHPLPLEVCENGVKATAWDVTSARCTPKFFAAHSVTELLEWSDYDLERTGRLTHPLRYDPETDHYVPVAWEDAFAEIGRQLRAVADRKRVVFYSSGRAALETSYMYALLARMYGNNNLPDSSNMCHETTSVALPKSIGVPVGTVTLDDFETTDCILSFGQNVGSNSPRMLHQLQEASRRGVPIVTFNPLRERGWVEFTNPQSPTEMLTGAATPISSAYHQVRAGGDLAALTALCKAVVALDAADGNILDREFIARHTHGFEDFLAWLQRQEWNDLERRAGLTRAALESASATYARAPSAMAIYGMGLTQHRAGVATVQMLVNLLLLRGNIGRPGAGICPVRGHSNVQGQRTVGISEKPELVPLDRLERQFGFTAPRETGLNTVEACEKILAHEIDAFLELGGNFIRAIPDRDRMEPAWRDIPLTVQVITKLNRSALVHGRTSFVLPPLSRIERDVQAGGPQAVSMEDSLASIHGSRGQRAPASRHLRSEPAIVAGIARATLDPNPKLDWDAWVADYRLIRAAIAESYPKDFADFEQRMFKPGGFHRTLAARSREWTTPTGRANFITPPSLDEDPDMPEPPASLRMMTLRSNDQFNTTIYGYDDRFRGISGTRMVVLMNTADIMRLGIVPGESVMLETASPDNLRRAMRGFRVVPYDIPQGCVGTYYPEANALIPLWHYAEGSKVPAAKSVPVMVRREA